VVEANETPEDSTASAADAKALLEEAEAEAAAAEALAVAAQARARAARLRREALGLPDPDDYDDEDEDYDEDEDDDEDEDYDETTDEDDEYEEDYDESADEYDESVTERVGWRRWMPTIAVVAAVIGIFAFAGFSAYMVLEHRDTTRHQHRQAAFVAGAKQGVLNMISLDFNKAKADVQRVIDGSTGEFQADFQQRANDFISVVIESKAVTEGTVHAAALESINGNSAVVLVSATSQVTNSPPGKDEPPRMWRLRVTVAEVGGHYKMSKVEYVP
jgi:Mce-associated membrane protein